MACAICEVRKPRRFCPGVRGDICTICCGTEREVTVDCPLDCVYLQDAHQHERKPDLKAEDIPNQDIRITEGFIADHTPIVLFLSQALLDAAMAAPGTNDFDIREALDALVRTYRTLQSGVYYETRPSNPMADRIYAALQQAAADIRKAEQAEGGITRTRDTDVLGVLVFLQRLEVDHSNGRKRGRAFLGFLRKSFAAAPDETPQGSPLIVP